MQSIESYLTKEGWQKDWQETNPNIRRSLEFLAAIAEKPYDLYKNNRYVNLNANVLAAAYPSIKAATITSREMESAGFSSSSTAVGAGAADWATYVPVHLALHYLSNKSKFIDTSGRFNTKEFLKDAGKVYRTQLPSIALFYIMAGPLHYALMKAGMDADTANQVSYWGILLATRSLHTYNFWRSQQMSATSSQ